MRHLSVEQMEKFHAHALDVEELLDVDDHLAQCEECQARFFMTRPADSLKKNPGMSLTKDSEHLGFPQLTLYLDGTLDKSERRSIQEHLRICSLCSGEVEDLKEFRKNMPRTVQTQMTPVAKSSAQWKWLTAIALLIAIGSSGALFWYQNQIIGLQSRLKQVESEKALLQEYTEQRSSNEASVTFRDGPAEIRIQKDGSVIAALSIPESEQQAIHKLVQDQKFDIPAHVLELIGNREISSSVELPFSLLTPLGTAVATDHPVFRWEQLANTEAYQVRVFDSEFHPLSRSRWIQQTEWTPDQPLPAMTALTWQVAARKHNQEIISPFAPFPDAKFLILSQDEISKVKDLQNRYPYVHLILGMQYARFGLLDDAETEFVALQQLNPNSAEAIRLLESIRSLRSKKE